MMPLAIVKVGERVRILRVGGPETARKHLGALGFVPGAVVRVVSATAADGDLIVALHDSRIAVNGDISRHVFVEPLQ